MGKVISGAVVSYDDLVNLGYLKGTARSTIRQAKIIMVNRGFAFYDNKRLGVVPLEVVEEILGTRLGAKE
jgi:hypothetical protein